MGGSDATFSYEANRQPKQLLRSPEVEIWPFGRRDSAWRLPTSECAGVPL